MLENYHNQNQGDKRLLAVQAALEIAKAAAQGGGVHDAFFRVREEVKATADAIQEALARE
ncbi:hypothetical protein MXL54_03210 [Enterobacteriaceae bacterium G50]|nr:hypothetical protein [Enterobacteriaceae bacterium G50]